LQARLVDDAGGADAVLDVVATDRDRDERDLVRLDEGERLMKLVAQWIRAGPMAGAHGGGRFAGAPELRELEERVLEPERAVEIVHVTLVGLDEGTVRQRLHTSRARGAQRQGVSE